MEGTGFDLGAQAHEIGAFAFVSPRCVVCCVRVEFGDKNPTLTLLWGVKLEELAAVRAHTLRWIAAALERMRADLPNDAVVKRQSTASLASCCDFVGIVD